MDISRGMSGILLALLCIPDLTRLHPDFEPHLRAIVDHILYKQSSDGSFVEKDPVNWVSGCSGTCWLMVKAFLLWSDDKYKQSVIKCGKLVWRKGLSRKGPGLSNGLSGNGYVFLLLFELTNDKKYLSMARHFAKFAFSEIFQKESICQKPYGLFEGWPALVCYMIALSNPSKPQIPLFFDIFHNESVDLTEDFATLPESESDSTSVKTINENESTKDSNDSNDE